MFGGGTGIDLRFWFLLGFYLVSTWFLLGLHTSCFALPSQVYELSVSPMVPTWFTLGLYLVSTALLGLVEL